MKNAPLDPKSIPSELHAVSSWLNWTLLSNGNKSPVDQHGKAVGYNNTDAWLPMMDAIQTVRNNSQLQLGISLTKGGLKLANSYLWCLDLDGFVCEYLADDGVLELLEKAKSWAEVSPSGTGIKIFFLSDKTPATIAPIKFGVSKFAAGNPTVKKYQNRAIEIFSHSRFLAVTGDCIAGTVDGSPRLRYIRADDLSTMLDELNQWAIRTNGTGWSTAPKQRQGNTETDSAQRQNEYAKPLLEDMVTVLLYVDAEEEQIWSDTMNGIARTYGDDGRVLAHTYSKRSEKYDQAECDARYDRALGDLKTHPTGLTAWSIIQRAKQHPDWPMELKVKYEKGVEVDPACLFGGDVTDPEQLELPIMDALVDSVNKEYVWDTHGLQIYSLKTRMYVRKDGFMSHYQNQQVLVGKDRYVGLGSYWMKSAYRRNINGLTLAPKEGETTTTGAFNTWRGYSCDPMEGDITPFMDVFNHLLPDKYNRHFIFQWLAKMIQSPETPFKVSLAIHGRMQGTGKNTIFEAIGELLHRQHWCVIGNAQLTSSFNYWQLDKVFVIGDEVSNSSSRSEADLMKRYITASENNINPKGLPSIHQPNLIKYVLLSNRDEIVHIEGEDRRYFVAETTGTRLPKPMADRFYSWKKVNGLSHLLFHLLNFDASEFDPTAPAPMTEAKASVIEAGKSGLDAWVEEEISERIANGCVLVSIGDVLNTYQQATKAHTSDKAVSNAIKRAGGLKIPKQALLKSGRRIRLHSLANHEQYRDMSDSALGKAFEGMLFRGR